MKRSQTISLKRMRKTKRPFAFKFLSVSVLAGLVSACGGNQGDPDTGIIYQGVDDCVADGQEEAQCEAAYQTALAEAEELAPKFGTLEECQFEFGPEMCQESRSGNWFTPFMAGYLLSNALDRSGNYYSRPMYSRRYGQSDNYWISGSGKVYKSQGKTYQTRTPGTVQKSSTAQSKPKVSTISRGGFGSSVSAKSSWGSSKRSTGFSSSRRSSWGG